MTLSSQDLFVGMTEVDITPPVGYPHYRGISTGVHDSLYAKAIYFRQGKEQVVVVECDLLWISRNLSTDVRMAVAEQTDIPYHNIMIAGTHSHTSPAYDGDILELNEHRRDDDLKPVLVDDMDYYDWLGDQIAHSIIQAKDKSTVSRLEFGRDETKDISFNRRYLMNDGKIKTNPGFQNSAAIEPTGPIDPEVGMLLIKDDLGNRIGSLVNFAVHTDTKGGTEFSGDFPAYLSKSLKSTFGPEFISFYGQGACGNLNHYNTQVKKQLTSEQIGHQLASVMKSNISKLKPIVQPAVKALTEIVYAPLQHFTKEDLAWAMDRTAESLYDESDFFNLRRPMKIRSLQRIRETEAIPPTVPSGPWSIPLEIQAFRISDELAIVGLPGEVFVELGLAIKKASPFKTTMVIELTNSHIAYVPTKDEFPKGGYETINSRLAPGGGEMMVDSAIELLKSLKYK